MQVAGRSRSAASGARRALGVLVLMGWVLVPRAGWPHGQSKSIAECTIAGSRAELRVTFAAHDLLEALPELDRGRTGRLDDAALDAIARHVEQATRLTVGDTPCTAKRTRAAGLDDPPVEVQVKLELECPKVLRSFDLELHYLPGLAPPHLTRALITSGATRTQHVFSPESPRVHVERVVAAEEGALGGLRRWLGRRDPVALAGVAGIVLVLAVVGAVLVRARRRRGQ